MKIPETPWKELAALRDARQRLEQEQADARRRLEQLTAERQQAVEQDRHALAQAMRTGGKRPSDDAVRDLDARIDATERDLDAVALALEDVDRDTVRLVEEHRDRGRADVAKREAARRHDVDKALDRVEEAMAHLASELALEAWLRDPRRFKTPALRLLAEPTQAGEPRPAHDLVAALRELTRPPASAATAGRMPAPAEAAHA